MTFLPVVERELRVRARQKNTYRFRVGGALIAILFLVFMMVAVRASSPQSVGQPTFTTLAWLLFFFCLIDGVRSTADCLSEEKRAGTLGLLFLTDLKGYDVVLGKLMATSLNSFYALLAIFPPLAIPILVGGVTGGEFWRLVLVLMNTLFFSLCAGMLISSLSRDEKKAWGSTLAVIGGITLAPLLFRFIPWISWLEAASPGVGFISLFDAAYSANPDRYTTSLLLVHLMAWGFLIAASVLLPRVWQEEPKLTRKSAHPLMRPIAWLGTKEGLRLGPMNPVTWLALKQEGTPLFLWLLIAAVAGGGVVSWWIGRKALGTILLGALAVHSVIAARVAAQACQFFAEARNSGSLELLLATPLPATEIVEGYRQALKRIFVRPVVTLVVIEFIIVNGLVFFDFDPVGLTMIPVTAWCLAIIILDLYAAAEYGMWLGLASKTATQAFSKTMLFVLILPALSCCVWPVLSLVKDLILINYARDQLRRRFRIIAAERFASGEKEMESPRALRPKSKHDLPSVLAR